MRVTNKYSLPAAIVAAIANDPYDRGECFASVTELVGPAPLAALRRAHAAELEEDASERIWSLLGQSVHHVIQRAEQAHELAEQRLTATISSKVISGQFDLFDGETLTDFKVTSAWAVKDGAKDEWVAQLNVLAHLLEVNGFAVKRLQIVAILRDWSKTDLLRYGDSGYPSAPVVVLPVELWDHSGRLRYITDRLVEHVRARGLLASGREFEECSPSERWARPTTWAVMKEGRKTALRVLDSLEAAQGYIEDQLTEADQAKASIVERPGEDVRCQQYCPVKAFCPYGSKLK